MKKLLYFIVLFSILMGVSCSGSRSYTKKALKLQEAGLTGEAADFFYKALQRNPKNVDAKIGLKQTGQAQIEKTLNKFYKAYSVKNIKESVYLYQEVLGYVNSYGRFVDLELPPYYEDYYQEMLQQYLTQRYKAAEDFLYAERYQEANQVYSEIYQLSPDYEDVQEKMLISKIEPIYQEGISLFEKKKYRTCYKRMSEILSLKPDYKSAIDYKDRSLELGRLNIAVFPFDYAQASSKEVALKVQSEVVSNLVNVKDPFIRVVDRNNTDLLIKEQKISANMAITGNNAILTGELLGANTLVLGNILSYSVQEGSIRRQAKQGFEKHTIKKQHPETKKYYTETQYKRVMYYEYYGVSEVFVEVKYQMVSAETGQVIYSNIVRKRVIDEVSYIQYSGNSRILYPGKYSGSGSTLKKGDAVYTSGAAYRDFKSKLRSRNKTLKSKEVMTAEAVAVLSNSIVNGIHSYNPDAL